MLRMEELREQLASYIANEIPFSVFEDWLLGQSWNMHLDSSSAAQEIVHEINSLIYEYLDGYVNEGGLKRGLHKLMRTHTFLAGT